MSDTNEKRAAEQAAGLRALADLVEANPELADEFRHAFQNMNVFVRGDNASDEMASLVRTFLRHKATVTKKTVGKYMVAVAAFGPVEVEINLARDEVCERIQVGEETVPVYEYKCRPLLAAEGGS